MTSQLLKAQGVAPELADKVDLALQIYAGVMSPSPAKQGIARPTGAPVKGMGKRTGDFSAAERAMIQKAEEALRGAGYDTSIMKEVIRGDLGKGVRGMTIGTDGAVVTKEALTSQAMLTHVLEEELRHLQQKAAGLMKQVGPGTIKELEEAAGAARKFPEPKQ